MSKYALNKYWNSSKYGTTVNEGSLSWALEIDWDNDKIFDGRNDGVNLMKLSIRRGRQNFLKSDGSGFEEVKEGTFIATLLNEDGTYDPYNTSSVLYPNIQPGKLFRLRVMDNSTNIIYSVMYGIIEDIRPQSGEPETVVISGVDKLKQLKNIKSYSQLVEGLGTDEAMLQVLGNIGWDWTLDGYVDVDNATEYLPYWWSTDNAYDELSSLAESALGNLFIANDGSLTFRSKYGSDVLTYTLGASDILREIVTPQPWETIRNAIRITVNGRTVIPDDELWSLQDAVPIAIGETITLWASYKYAGNVQDVPVTSVDYIVSSSSDGLGADLTASCPMTFYSYGEAAKIVITNNSGLVGYVTTLRIVGDGLPPSNAIIVEDTNSTNITQYSRKELNLDNKWIQQYWVAKDFANYLKTYLTEGRLFLTVKLIDNPAKQFGADLFSRINVNLPDKGIEALAGNNAYMVSYIQHDWINAIGSPIVTTFQLEPFPQASLTAYWTFSTHMGVETLFAY